MANTLDTGYNKTDCESGPCHGDQVIYMENSNSRNTDASGATRLSDQRKKVLAVILGVLALWYATYAFFNWYNIKAVKKAGDDYTVFMAAVTKADAIADPLQRCLSYPDFPGSHWNAETTRAYCEFRNHETLQPSDIEALLKQGKANEVDLAFQGYLATQRSDPKQPGLLDIAFVNAGFDDGGDDARRVIDLWKQQSPNSAFAFTASGIAYVDAAQKARGDGSWEDTDRNQKIEMRRLAALAREDLDRAASLNPLITTIYPSMIYAGTLEGDNAYMNNAAESGLNIDRSNFGIRTKLIHLAQPKWGSNFGGVDEQSKEDLSLAGVNPLLRMVAQRSVVYGATCGCYASQSETNGHVANAIDKLVSSGEIVDLAAEVYDTDRRLAVELYSEALRFDPTNVDALRWRSQEMIALGDKSGATAAFAAVARRFPKDNAMSTQLGNVYAQAGDVKHSEATLLAVLARDPDNYDAMGTLGDLYNHGGHQPQKAEELADALISKYPDKPGGYIVRSCNQMDHNLPGVYDTIHFFIDHFGNDPQWKSQTAEMRTYLINHPVKPEIKK